MYDTIIVPTDGSDAAQSAVEHGISQAGAHDARLFFLAVVEMSGSTASEAHRGEAVEEKRTAKREVVDALVGEATEAGVDAEGIVEVGIPSRVIVEEATDRGIDMIIMGTQARSGVGRFLFGSVTDQVIQDGEIPVLAIQS
ncbi:MAG: universal stress protein UspA related nucleotide-binding protein [halophilic archaeon J07HX64]|jgi:Universal stress protein UspA and related nucleotide-binding proteins|nr:MAG: universal stress protein UspA related nucleotide-binding protein [halophilic archaeon J07HX64]